MANLASLGAGFDLLWAEGSAYTIGFENALRAWRPLLRPGGCLVVTELVWFAAAPAERARAFFANAYPDMRDEATRIDQARSACDELVASFRLPADDWHAYDAGLEAPLRAATTRHFGSSGSASRPAAMTMGTCARCFRSFRTESRGFWRVTHEYV